MHACPTDNRIWVSPCRLIASIWMTIASENGRRERKENQIGRLLPEMFSIKTSENDITITVLRKICREIAAEGVTS